MKKLSILAVLALVLLATPAALHAGASTVTTNIDFDVTLQQYVPCALGGAGEVVELSGTLHRVVSVTIDAQGIAHVTRVTNPQGIAGVGLTSGDTYVATGVAQRHRNLDGSLPMQVTTVDSFNVIGPGPGNNLLIHALTRLTVNANGTVVVDETVVSIECR